MKKLLLAGVLFISSLLIGTNAIAQLYTISIEGLSDPSEIESISLWFDVSDDFELLSSVELGSAIPESEGYGWSLYYGDLAENDSILMLEIVNEDYLMDGISNSLLDGDIVTFDYSGSILDIDQFQFGDVYGDEISIELLVTGEDGTVFTGGSAVPVPPAFLLLGSGLVGMLGIRRKLNK